MFVDMREIIRHEIASHGVDRVGRAQCFGKCALHESHDAVAYETTVVLVTVLRQSAQRQHGVATDGQIADRVEQRSIEIENSESGHPILCLFCSKNTQSGGTGQLPPPPAFVAPPRLEREFRV